MAGHFLVRSISRGELVSSSIGSLGAITSARQHVAVGWNAASRLVLTNALSGVGIGNRDGLPPHVYLQFGSFQNDGAARQAHVLLALRSFDWVDNAVRPAVAGLGLRTLCVTAQAHWAAGRRADAIYAQALHGQASIELYYVNNEEL